MSTTVKSWKELLPIVIVSGAVCGIGLGLTAGLAYLVFQLIANIPLLLKSLFSLL